MANRVFLLPLSRLKKGNPVGLALVCAMAAACDGTERPLLHFHESDAAQGGAKALDESKAGGEAGASAQEVSWLLPPASANFQIQLRDELDIGVEAEVYVIDIDATSGASFEQLRQRGVYVACYFSAGSYESWREDAVDFPAAIRGSALPDYADEEWLNVSDARVLELMAKRMERARLSGCQAVYPSLVRPEAGMEEFSLTEESYVRYAGQLAQEAHALELAAFSSGGAILEPTSVGYDAVIIFGCAKAGTCDSYGDFGASGGALYSVEEGQESTVAAVCEVPGLPAWPTIVKPENLGAFHYLCP